MVSLSYLAAERAVPGYGGGMSSAKAALEGDTRTLAYEAGRRWGIRVNTISAGPLASRAAKAIGTIDRMVDVLPRRTPRSADVNTADDVGDAAAFLCSPAGRRHHRRDAARGQGLPRHGDGRRAEPAPE